MTVPNFISKVFSYQDLHRGTTMSARGAWSDENTLSQIGLSNDLFIIFHSPGTCDMVIHQNFVYSTGK